MMKKHEIHKKTLDYKSKLTVNTVKMPSKCVAMPTIDIMQLIGNKRQNSTKGDSTNVCVCLYRLLKLLTDDQVTSQRYNSKHIILSWVL